ncbi:hypothetical protein LguiB_013846 [Lonicera macranthoides]
MVGFGLEGPVVDATKIVHRNIFAIVMGYVLERRVRNLRPSQASAPGHLPSRLYFWELTTSFPGGHPFWDFSGLSTINFGVLMGSEASSPCVACAHSHKRCPLAYENARIFPNMIDREDYHIIFTVFGVRNVASFLQRVPENRLHEALNSYLLEATARIENPVRGCTALLASFEQKVEELQARVTALEARLGGGPSCVNPLCSFAPLGGSLRFPSSAGNNVPNVIPTAMDLSEPIPGGFLGLLMSEEGVQNILSTTTNLIENGASLTEMNLPSFQNPSYNQATLDSVYQAASEGFLSQSSLDDFVADFAEITGPDWTASGNIHHDFSDYSSSDLNTILNFDADDLQILQLFFE